MLSNETVELTHELHQNFIEYAMAVNTDRSLPDAMTGLKPVHRRIIYDAYVNKHTSDKVHVKCANIVGETMADYHPHGDSSIYGALVRLSENWTMRYPLIDFHGNNGNIAGDPPAHYRYTECRLAKLTEDGLLAGIKKDNVDMMPNYSETKQEPQTLPSYFPNLLVNPNTGIGVAMACNWLPHNLREVESAVLQYVNGEEPMLPGPDFPTGGLIINKDDIPKIMASGKGSVKVRAQYKMEGMNIVYYEVPYGLTTESLLDEIKEVCSKEYDFMEGVTGVRDESNRKGLRLVVECSKTAQVKKIIECLFQETNLQTSISYNQVALVNKKPELLNLKQCIAIFLKHGNDCVSREAMFDITKIDDRLEIIDGLLRALEDIDNIIALIKATESPSKVKQALIDKYKFTDAQAEAIAEMKLRKLAHLGKVELQEEKAGLIEEQTRLKAILAAPQDEFLKRFHAIVEKYGDARRTELAQIAEPKKQKEVVVPDPEDVVVIITNTGAIKRIPRKSFKVQKRNTTGVKTNGDIVAFTASTNTQDTLMVFSSKGKMYRLIVDKIPEGSNTSSGAPLASLIEFEKDEVPMAYTTLSRDTDKKFIFFATKKGITKKVPLEEYDKMKRTGIIAINLKEGDELAAVTFIEQENMMLVTKKGVCIQFATDGMPISSRIAQGVKGMNVGEDDYVIAALPIMDPASDLAIVSTTGQGKRTKLSEFSVQGRGGKGLTCYKGELAGVCLVNDEDNILINGNKSSIVTAAAGISQLGRVSTGVALIKNNDAVLSISKF